MKFKKRPEGFTEPAQCIEAGDYHYKPPHTYRPGHEITLHHETKDPRGLLPGVTLRHDELRAKVLRMNGEKLWVRAKHGVYLTSNQCIMESGTDFEVDPDEVFIVSVPD